MGATGSSGKLTDVLRLQVQIKALQSELIQMEVNKKPLIAKFNQLLGVEQTEKINLSEKFEPINIAGLVFSQRIIQGTAQTKPRQPLTASGVRLDRERIRSGRTVPR